MLLCDYVLNQDFFYFKSYTVGLYGYVLVFDRKGMVCAVNADGGEILELISKGKNIKKNISDAFWSDFINDLKGKDILLNGSPTTCPNWIDPCIRSSLKSKEAHQFNEVCSSYYSSIFHSGSHEVDTFTLFSQHLISYIDSFISPGITVLDVGCGSGQYSEYMAAKGAKVYALDIASNVPQELSDNNSHQVVFNKGDATNLPFNADKFDFVLCSFILEHVADVEVVVSEMFRVLKKGGHLLIAIPVIPIEGLLPRLNKRLYLDFFHWRAFSPLPFSLSWKMSISELLRYIKGSGGMTVKYESVRASILNDMKLSNSILHKVKVAAMKHLWPFKYFGEQAIVLCKKT